MLTLASTATRPQAGGCLKMADERSQPPHNQPSPIPAAYAWPALLAKDGDALFDHYRHTLKELGKQPGTLALIFGKAQNKFDSHRLVAMLTLRAPCGRPISAGNCQDPAKLWRVIVDLIDAENWSAMGADVKGDAYEGLLERNAQDNTPRLRLVAAEANLAREVK